jgi:hypothetical protein
MQATCLAVGLDHRPNRLLVTVVRQKNGTRFRSTARAQNDRIPFIDPTPFALGGEEVECDGWRERQIEAAVLLRSHCRCTRP